MKKPIFTTLLFQLLVFLSTAQTASILEFKNGSVWNGESFSKTNFWVKDGRLSFKPVGDPTRVVDLTNQFVIPPLGDANSLSFDGAEGLDFFLPSSLNEGYFYFQEITNSQAGRSELASKTNSPEGPDVAFANGVLTCTNGEPSNDLETRAVRQKFPKDWQSRLETMRQNPILLHDSYWFINNDDELKANWPRIVALKPSCIVVSLRDVENGPRHGGLSPEMAKKVVKKAHKADLRVFASIETAADFRASLDAGVDVIANLPGHRWDGTGDSKRFELNEKDWAKARKKKVTVVSNYAKTALLVGGVGPKGNFVTDTARARRMHDFVKMTLKSAFDAKIPVAFGSDEWGKNSRSEMNFLMQMGVIPAQKMIQILCETTPRTVFPERKIGRLETGYEASFLVIEDDPLKNVLNMRRILMRVKNGEILKTIDPMKK